MQPSSGIKTWQWVVTVIVIIVLIIIGISVFSNKTPSTGIDTTPVVDNSATPGALNRVVMTDQFPGNVVYLSSVQLDKPGFVVIHADNNGMPGAVLGETYFAAGINTGKITLSSPLVDGKTYYAMLHSDNGNGKYDGEVIDAPLKDAAGNIIMKIFHASATAGNNIKG